jgi:hypothetical protein
MFFLWPVRTGAQHCFNIPHLIFLTLCTFFSFISRLSGYFCVKWVSCHHGMARPQVEDGGEGLQIWWVAANILNKQTRTDDKR